MIKLTLSFYTLLNLFPLGWRCEKCKKGYFGDPLTGGCQACLCDPFGSLSVECDNITGRCLCKEHFVGRTCEECEVSRSRGE